MTWDERIPIEYRDAVTQGDALALLARLPDGCLDAVIADPPYAEVDRSYGRWTEAAWMTLMQATVRECRRVLRPSGSAVFIIQPNSEKLGRLRPWVFDFVAWCCREWNVVQDAYWWNHVTIPQAGCGREYGLLRPSLKFCVWVGDPCCYRNQDAVLWRTADSTLAQGLEDRALAKMPSGHSRRRGRLVEIAIERGGTTPYNVLPLGNSATNGAGGYGHGAGTPLALCRWWVRYLCPVSTAEQVRVVCDPFFGSGTVGIAARREGRNFIGFEKEAAYVAMARRRLAAEAQEMMSEMLEAS